MLFLSKFFRVIGTNDSIFDFRSTTLQEDQHRPIKKRGEERVGLYDKKRTLNCVDKELRKQPLKRELS